MDIPERTVTDAPETCGVNHIIAFTKEVLGSALCSLLMSIVEDESGIRE